MNNPEEELHTSKHPSAMLMISVRGQQMQKIKLENDSYSIGASTAAGSPDIPVSSSLFAALQGVFARGENGYTFTNHGAPGSTWYNGALLKSSEDPEDAGILLKNNDILRIDSPSDGNSHQQAVVLIYHNHYTENVEWRTMNLDAGKVKLYISRHEEMASDSTEVLEDLAELPRRYATLIKEGDAWCVEDHSTMFGVLVNNKKIEGRQELRALDVIGIGNSLFLYQKDTLSYNHMESARNCLVVHIEERSVWNLFKKHTLLEDIDLTVRPGEMVLILGGSGAGKTTFINAVMGYEKAKGKIMEGDIDVYENYNQMKYEIGFVPQQDLLRMEDVVYDTLENAAEMKMPKSTTEEERTARIKQLLELFGLEREEKSLVSKLSGGQRKRLSIAVEFIADPVLFFLDEPDSGLDGVMARSLMENLRGIADQNKMVLVITHSPNRVADLFDKVIVLAKSAEDNVGHMAFYGTPTEANAFFETDSMENIIRRINRTDEGGEGLADTFIDKYTQLKEQNA